MKRMYFIPLLLSLLSLLFTGCREPQPDVLSVEIPYEGTAVAYAKDYVDITVTLPDGWSHETVACDPDHADDAYGIRFWPDAEPSLAVSLMYHPAYPGTCGTGKVFDDLTVPEDTGRVIRSTEQIGENKNVCITWEDLPYLYMAEYTIADSLFDTYNDTILEILVYAKLSQNAMTRTEAIEAVLTEYPAGEEIAVSAPLDGFDTVTGIWYVNAVHKDGDIRQFQVAPDGTASASKTAQTAKPVIYLYPEEETDVHVSLSFDGTLTCTYPPYGEDGWHVTASPDGTLINYADKREYSYLFWEGVGNTEYDLSEGFCVAGADTADFLQEMLAALGLTPQEYNEFIVYWLPLMQENPYNLITFQWEDYDAAAPLVITPDPDTILRVFMVWKALEKPIDIPTPVLPAAPERNGFTVIEWGGMRYD